MGEIMDKINLSYLLIGIICSLFILLIIVLIIYFVKVYNYNKNKPRRKYLVKDEEKHTWQGFETQDEVKVKYKPKKYKVREYEVKSPKYKGSK